MTVIADKITDDQVRDLYRDGLIHVDVVDLAMFGTVEERSEARAICADLLNAAAEREAHAHHINLNSQLGLYDAETDNHPEDELAADDLANGESYEDCP